jgi:EAL domain-containing protein (putative c-di-GMP-specific phosphodiesterase class I)
VLDVAHQHITGAEALLRWPDPELGWIPPIVFVPIAEETGLMMRIGDWVLHEACRELRSWIDGGLPPLRMAVNVARCQLERGGLLASVRSALAETGVPPERVELELSERGVLRGDTEVLTQLREIKALGVRLLVDDFGTGDSSITYLRQFPIDGVKVDRALIGGLGERSQDAAITAGIVSMARRLGLATIAEGVEEPVQLECLTALECGQAQGFLFSPAVPPEEFRSMVRAGAPVRRRPPGTAAKTPTEGARP